MVSKVKPHRPAVSRLLDPRKKSDVNQISMSEWDKAVRAGFAVTDLQKFKKLASLSNENLSEMLGISKSTINRMSPGQKLNLQESDRLVRYLRLFALAVSLFESRELAIEWFFSPQPGLGGETPFEFAKTEAGAREVENLIGRIEHSVIV